MLPYLETPFSPHPFQEWVQLLSSQRSNPWCWAVALSCPCTNESRNPALQYKLWILRSTRDRQQCNHHSPAAYTNYSIPLLHQVRPSRGSCRIYPNLSDDHSSRKLTHPHTLRHYSSYNFFSFFHPIVLFTPDAAIVSRNRSHTFWHFIGEQLFKVTTICRLSSLNFFPPLQLYNTYNP